MNLEISKVTGVLNLRTKGKKPQSLDLATTLLKAIAIYSEISELANASNCTVEQIKSANYLDSFYIVSNNNLKKLLDINSKIP